MKSFRNIVAGASMLGTSILGGCEPKKEPYDLYQPNVVAPSIAEESVQRIIRIYKDCESRTERLLSLRDSYDVENPSPEQSRAALSIQDLVVRTSRHCLEGGTLD